MILRFSELRAFAGLLCLIVGCRPTTYVEETQQVVVPLKVWVVLAQGEQVEEEGVAPGHRTNKGCRFTETEITQRVQIFQNNACLYGIGSARSYGTTTIRRRQDLMNAIAKLSVIILAYSVSWQELEASDCETALSKLENWKAEYTSDQLREWAEVIRLQAKPGDRAVAKRLLSVVSDEKVHPSVRTVAIRLLPEKADGITATELVATLTRWCLELCHDDVYGQVVTEHRLRVNTVLIAIAINEHLAHLEQAVPDQEPLLQLLTLLATHPKLTGLPHPYAAIANSPAPLELRRACAFEVIRSDPQVVVCPAPLLPLFGPESFPAFREMIRECEDPDDFPYLAASVLAHYGDEEIVPDLEAWTPRMAASYRYGGDYVGGYIWQIQAQHPPAKLLEYVKSEGHKWAMQRAVELGIPKSDVREAFLTYVARLRSSGTQKDKWRMITAKRDALQVGVLQPDDLPDVIIPKLRVEH